MAEVVSLAASIISLTQFSSRLLKRINDLYKGYSLSGIREEVQVYGGILGELGEMALSSTQQMPPTVEPCLRLCYQRMMEVESLLPKETKPKRLTTNISSDEMAKAIKSFTSSVKLLRDVMMECERFPFLLAEWADRVNP